MSTCGLPFLGSNEARYAEYRSTRAGPTPRLFYGRYSAMSTWRATSETGPLGPATPSGRCSYRHPCRYSNSFGSASVHSQETPAIETQPAAVRRPMEHAPNPPRSKRQNRPMQVLSILGRDSFQLQRARTGRIRASREKRCTVVPTIKRICDDANVSKSPPQAKEHQT